MRFPAYPSYKDSGVSWLVEIPAHWTEKRLRFVAGLNPVRSEVNHLPEDTLTSFVPMEAVGEYGGLVLESEKQIVDVKVGYTYFADGDVVLAKITPCFENGKGALVEGLLNGIAFGTTELHVVRAGKELHRRFLFYLTMSHPFRKIGEAMMYGAGGQKRVPEDFIKDFRPGLPPIEEQTAIAAFLDRETVRIDSLIEKKRRFLKLLQEKRSALISHAVTRGLNPNASLRDSGIEWLGRIPAHWGIKRLKFSLNNIEQGWSPLCENSEAGMDQWGVLKVGCVNGNEFDETENKTLPADIDPIAAYEINNGDILMSRANTRELLGSVALVKSVRPRLLLCDKLYRLRIRKDLTAPFLVFFMRSPLARYQYERDSTGASGSMQNIGQDTVKNLLMPVPPTAEQEAIMAYLDCETARLDNLRTKVESAIEKLKEYRAALITAAVTGKIDVREAA